MIMFSFHCVLLALFSSFARFALPRFYQYSRALTCFDVRFLNYACHLQNK